MSAVTSGIAALLANIPNSQEVGSSSKNTGTSSVFDAWSSFLGSSAAAVVGICVGGSVTAGGGNTLCVVEIGAGAVGLEVAIGRAAFRIDPVVASLLPAIIIPLSLPAHTRFSYRSYVGDLSAASLVIGWSVSEHA